ncbi:hypothetical protein JW848_08045 [Candidatus Bipolaricaulota bacterium]|nr:hypothetical protein [Candidatus Bipolaricaulota bacterium]
MLEAMLSALKRKARNGGMTTEEFSQGLKNLSELAENLYMQGFLSQQQILGFVSQLLAAVEDPGDDIGLAQDQVMALDEWMRPVQRDVLNGKIEMGRPNPKGQEFEGRIKDLFCELVSELLGC